MSATGTSIIWYNDSAGGSVLYDTTHLISGNHYYASQTIDGLESMSRLDVTAIIYPLSIAGSLAGSASVCSGSNSGSLNLSGYTGSITNWQSSTVSDFSSNVTDISNTSNSQTYNDLNVTTYYRAVITSGVCASAYSAADTITVSTSIPPQPGTITGSSAVCDNEAGEVYSISPVSRALSYTWSVPSGASITRGAGTTSITVTFGSVAGNVSVTANNGCGISAAETEAIAVNAIPTQPGAITGLTTVSSGQTGVTYSISSVSGASSYTWSVPSGAAITAGASTTGSYCNFRFIFRQCECYCR